MSFWKGLLSLLTGGISNIFTNGGFGNLGNILSNAGDTANDIGNQNLLGNYMAKQTGSRLTDAEREANSYTSEREDLAWERQLQADSSVYQRRVADMQAAGINPFMAASGVGTSGPSYSAAGSVSPGSGSLNLGSILQFALESKLLPAKIANLAADTAKKNAETSSTEQQVDFFDRVKGFREQGEKLANDLKLGEYKQLQQNISESKSRIGKIIAETNEADKRAALFVEQAVLAAAEAENIKFMQPFIAAELTARSASERAQAQAASVNAAYQQGLINEGAIIAAVRETNARASDLEIDAKVKDFKQSITDGSFYKAAERLGDWRSAVIGKLYHAVSNASKSVLGKW